MTEWLLPSPSSSPYIISRLEMRCRTDFGGGGIVLLYSQRARSLNQPILKIQLLILFIGICKGHENNACWYPSHMTGLASDLMEDSSPLPVGKLLEAIFPFPVPVLYSWSRVVFILSSPES